MLALSEYRDAIKLDEPIADPRGDTRSNYDLLMTALSGLHNKHFTGSSSMAHLSTDEGLWRWLASELAIRKPGPIDPVTSRAINTLLFRISGLKGRVEALNLRRVSEAYPQCDFQQSERVALFLGDISQLAIDAVVNTALPDMTGCPIPLHGCLDSEIHAQAGPWLQNDCAKIIEIKGGNLEPGDAVLTRGYRLPARYVIHTLGPKVQGAKPTAQEREQLALCYRNILDLCLEKGDIRSVAFPAISTGGNSFPAKEAANIALKTVEDWLAKRAPVLDLVLFSLHTDADTEVYSRAMKTWVTD
ncbi:macro domain-containing protein [Arcanobacterium urinimassiliense]|uniref:macro domain-containing protein n=1 Tax=Arcanobacterium urinimassiliense TaxID=1871014 RepID=UPI00093947E2|nr:macro domain-containing protein [Arcanobacterium urinimassiliense]